ncbi:MAG TPA: ATP-binding cassette domain-containing protein, partial [Thermoanaerobaculia bacterium]|nr:ATP-binding cassette domain-containing protein [Thermoanaerobaculia bacterium]
GARLFPREPRDPSRPTLEVVRGAIAPFDEWRREMAELAGGLAALESDAPGADARGAEALARWSELEARFHATGGWDVDARIERELALLGLGPSVLERPFATLSGGEQTRALIAALFLVPDAFALIDEPTNHLDLRGRELLAEYLAAKPGFLLASHDRVLLDACADHTVSIERTGVSVLRGGYSAWKRERDRREESERHRHETLEREVAHLRRAARDRRAGAEQKERSKRGAGDKGFIGHRAAKQMKRATEIERRVERRIEERSTLLRDWEKERELALQSPAKPLAVPLKVSNLVLRLDGRILIDRLSFELVRGARIALIGPNGCGKTKALDAIAGERLPAPFTLEGVVALAPRALVTRAHQVPRWRTGFLRDRLRADGIDETWFRQLLGGLDIERDLFEHPLETLSQGQLKKADLARSFLGPQDLLIWDEPMNYLDVLTRERIEEAILGSEATLLVVEHDRAFIDRIATEVITLGS